MRRVYARCDKLRPIHSDRGAACLRELTEWLFSVAGESGARHLQNARAFGVHSPIPLATICAMTAHT